MSMTSDEAIRILAVNGWGFTDGELKEATQMAIQALKEQDEYKEAHNLRIARDVIWLYDDYPMFMCPNCRGVIEDEDHCWEDFYKCCPYCGQVLKW